MSEANKELQNIAGAGGGGCFRKGAQVQLQHGRTIAIELLKQGDEVLAFDEKGRIQIAKVKKVHFHNAPQPILKVRFWRGETHITPNHWVLNQYNSFVEMGSLTEHDALVDGMGHLRPITGVKLIAHEPVWNLTVEPHHTFICDGVRVHNGGHRERYPVIEGAGGGGGGKGGGGSARAAVEDADSLQSRALIGIIDLLGEGEQGGLVDGAKSIYLNDTPLQNADETYNFNNVWWDARTGTQNQSVIDGACFSGVSTPYPVGVRVKYDRSHAVSIANPQATAVTVIVTCPQLVSQDTANGDIHGSSVSYRFEVAVDGGPFVAFPSQTISGKTRSRYQRSHSFALPAGQLRVIRMIRETADSSSAAVSNETWFDSFVEIVERRLNYPNSSLVAIRVDAEQFGSIPRRSYLVNGIYIKVPSNYDPATRTYSGVWNGTLKLAVSGNPAWVLYDLLTSTRYGLGEYLQASQVDKTMLYQIGRYCDELVSDGMGGFEPRFTINTVIQAQAEAYKLIADISSVFRGMSYWTGGMVGFTYDAPRDPSMIFSPSNVIDGMFNYVGSARKDRHSVALITWNDSTENYKQKIEYVESAELVAKYGVRKTDMVAFGCTSRAQAHRLGRWMLYTEQYESNLVTFKVGIDSALVLPGEVVKVHDPYRAGKRMGGRLTSATLTSATLDAEVELAGDGALLSMRMVDGSFVECQVNESAGKHQTLTWVNPISEAPMGGAIYVVAETNLVPMLARVVGIEQGDKPGTSAITALEHNPVKYDVIENGYILEEPNTSIINPELVTLPSDLNIIEVQYEVLPGTIGTKLLVSWSGTMPSYELRWRRTGLKQTNWQTISTTYPSIEIDSAQHGMHEFDLVAINTFGKQSASVKATHDVLGKTYAPGDVTNFKVTKRITDLLLSWDGVTEFDLAGYEVRVGPSWDLGEVLMAKFMGTSMLHDQSEAGVYYYHIRAMDKSGNHSENVTTAQLVLDAPAAVTQFECAQSGGRIDFKWAANSEINIAGYEIREGASWTSSTLVTQVMATSYSMFGAIPGNRTFWVKAIVSPGIYSEVAAFSIATVVVPSDRNVVFESDQMATGWTGTKYQVSVDAGGFLVLDGGATYGEYTWEVSLPATFLARNYLNNSLNAVVSNDMTWSDATFQWNSPEATRPWLTSGDLSSVDLDLYISKYQTGVGYGPFVSFIAGDHEYQNAKFKAVLRSDGASLPRITALSLVVDVPDVRDRGSVTLTAGAVTSVTYNRSFYSVDEVIATLKGGTTFCTPRVSNVTKDGFDVALIDASNNMVAGQVSWVAEGY